MAYLAFYRTFRPMTFDAVVRQEHIVRTLKNQISTGKIGHAYLFCGPRGTGKTTLAKIFAREINCENPVDGSPCGKCEVGKSLESGASLDVSEIDAASNNGVDEMRDLREKVQYPPVSGRYKVYIIDEVHMLTSSAFNAVLKTLEEPPAHAVFILATTEPQKIPATILSRCMRFDFKLIPQKDLENLIKSVYGKVGKSYEDEAVSAIARAGAGSARDSLSIADTCASYSQGKLTYADVNEVLGSADFNSLSTLLKSIVTEDASSALGSVEDILSTGKSVGVLFRDLLNFLNNLSIVKICKNAKQIVNLPEETYNKVAELSSLCDGHKLLRVTEILSQAESDAKYSLNAKITLETAVLKCAMPSADYNIDALIGKISALEKKIENNSVTVIRKVPAVKACEPEKKTVQEKRKELIAEAEVPSPFKEPPVKDERQPTLFDGAPKPSPEIRTLNEGEKGGIFAKLIRLLRTTRKNAVLFTLCMDVGNFFEGNKLILTTESEAVMKGLTRTDNANFLSETLLELGVGEHEVRLIKKGESEMEKAVRELKKNFDGIDIEIK